MLLRRRDSFYFMQNWPNLWTDKPVAQFAGADLTTGRRPGTERNLNGITLDFCGRRTYS